MEYCPFGTLRVAQGLRLGAAHTGVDAKRCYSGCFSLTPEKVALHLAAATMHVGDDMCS